MNGILEKLGEGLRTYLKSYPEKSADLLKVETASLYLKSIQVLRRVILLVLGLQMIGILGVASLITAFSGVLTQIHWGTSNLGYQLLVAGILGMLTSSLGTYRMLSSKTFLEITHGDELLESTLSSCKKETRH